MVGRAIAEDSVGGLLLFSLGLWEVSSGEAFMISEEVLPPRHIKL